MKCFEELSVDDAWHEIDFLLVFKIFETSGIKLFHFYNGCSIPFLSIPERLYNEKHFSFSVKYFTSNFVSHYSLETAESTPYMSWSLPLLSRMIEFIVLNAVIVVKIFFAFHSFVIRTHFKLFKSTFSLWFIGIFIFVTAKSWKFKNC